jgi:nicotinate-nucleotide adenylyltransferase
MIRAAIGGEPRFDVEESELARPGISYTIDTVLALRKRYGPDAAFFYLVGGDNLEQLPTWRRFAELETQVTFVVLGRGERTAWGPNAAHGPVLPRRFEVSATEIRQRIAAGQSIRYLVPESVRELIARHELYR